MDLGNVPQGPLCTSAVSTAPATMNEMYEQCKKSPDLPQVRTFLTIINKAKIPIPITRRSNGDC